MGEDRTVKGLLCLETNESDEPDSEEWALWVEVEWNGVKAKVRVWLDAILTDFESHEVEITIKSLKAPEGPK